MTSPFKIKVQSDVFDPGEELRRFTAAVTDHGAVVTFTGLVRDFYTSENKSLQNVDMLELEHYPEFTEAEITKIATRAVDRWADIRLSLIHRYGQLAPGEPIVFIAVSSSHRQDAFDAASFLMDYLKTKAPFWKKEHRGAVSQWIEPKATDYLAQQNWETHNENTALKSRK